MKCNDVQKRLIDYSEALIDRNISAQIETHLRSCAQCSQELKTFEETVRLLQSVPIKEPPEEFWNDFTRGVMQNVRRVERANVPALAFRFPRLKMAVVAVATILLLIVGLFFYTSGGFVGIFQKHPQQIAQQPLERNSPSYPLDEALEKIVPSKTVEEMLHSEWALLDGQQLPVFEVDASDEMIDFLLENLNESEKQALLVELERMK